MGWGWGAGYLLLPGGEGPELACVGDGAALAGGDVLLPLDRRPVDHEVLVVVVGCHGRGILGVGSPSSLAAKLVHDDGSGRGIADRRQPRQMGLSVVVKTWAETIGRTVHLPQIEVARVAPKAHMG